MSILKEIKALKTCPHAEHDVKLGKDAEGNRICTTCNNKVIKKFDVKLAIILFFICFVIFLVVLVTLAALTTGRAPRMPAILALSTVAACFGAFRYKKPT
jgi:Trk-type K+ transport system membrane component